MRTLALALALADFVRQSPAQTENPVYVDDSPQAWEMFRQAQDQARHNAGEAVRLYQELLDEFALKLIPAIDAAGAADHFKSVRQRVLASLRNDSALLERYRMIQKQPAEQMLKDSEQPTADVALLEQLALTRSLTDAGLEALLRLAQRELESGRFRRALAHLEEARLHPELAGRRAVHTTFMYGTASFYAGDADAAEQAHQDLGRLGVEAEALWQRLGELINARQQSALPQTAAVTALDMGAASDLQDVVAQAIWSVPLEDSLLRRRLAMMSEDQPLSLAPAAAEFARRAEQERNADALTSIPTVVGETAFINEGHTIRALNRLSGRQLWSYANASHLSFTERDLQGSLDLSVIAMDGNTLVTLTGHAQPGGRPEAGRILCLDAAAGTLRWSTNLSAPPLVEAAANEQLFPHGAPVIAEGMVYVCARRVSMQSMTSAYVVALDLNDGKVQWLRYITSSGGMRALRPFDTLVHHRGDLYVSTAVGATARLNPRNGETKWLVRFTSPFNTGLAEQSRRPWDMTGPVVTHRGVLAIEPSLRRVSLLDAETGATLESHEAGAASDWSSPRYLLADDERVYSIGTEILAFDLDDLEHAAWRLPGPQTSSARSGAPGAQQPDERASSRRVEFSALDLRGRVQLVEGALIAPTGAGVLVIDSQTGEITNSLPIHAAGNPIAVDSQLLLAGGDRLDAYMSFNKAQSMLRERIAQSPSDPEPALSLLRLGLRVTNLELALEAADLATRALNRMPEQEAAAGGRRDELMALLLELAGARLHSSSAQGEALFAAMDAAAVDSPQRVDYLLAYGDWLSASRLDRAVEVYQSILSDRALADCWQSHNGVLRPAAEGARQRLRALIAERGPTVYAAQSDFAAIRVKHLTAPGAKLDLAELQALADEFPFSDAAVEAALRVADAHAQKGDHRSAAAALMRAYRAAPREFAAARLLARFVAIAQQVGWRAQADAVMQHVQATYGDIALIGAASGGGSQQPSEYFASLSGALTPQLPIISPPSPEQVITSKSIAGSLVPIHPAGAAQMSAARARSIWPADVAFIRVGNTLRLVRGMNANAPAAPDADAEAGPQIVWSCPFSEEPVATSIIALQEDQVVLWLGTEPQDSRIAVVSMSDGVLRWTSPTAAELLGESAASAKPGFGGRSRDPMPDGEPFDPAAIIPLVSDDTLILVQRSGAIAAVDLTNGTTARWKKTSGGGQGQSSLDQIHVAELHESALILAGMIKSPNPTSPGEALTPTIIALDPRTGQPLFNQSNEWLVSPRQSLAANKPSIAPTAGSAVRWMRSSPLGVLMIGTGTALHAIDLHSGRRMWSNVLPQVGDSGRAWFAMSHRLDGRLVIEDQRGRLRSLHLSDGSASDQFEIPWRNDGGSPGVVSGWEGLELRNAFIVPAASASSTTARVIAQYSQRVVIYDATTGSILGADVISDDREYRFMALARSEAGPNHIVVMSGRSVQAPVADQPIGGGGRRAQQWEYRIYLLSENGRVLSEPFRLGPLSERVQHIVAIHGWLLLSTPSETVAVPFQADS